MMSAKLDEQMLETLPEERFDKVNSKEEPN